jgi:hypothetical protein
LVLNCITILWQAVLSSKFVCTIAGAEVTAAAALTDISRRDSSG